MTTHKFNSALGRDLFSLGASMSRPVTQKMLQEAYEGEPWPVIPTEQEINRLAAIDAEKISEGRIVPPPHRFNHHD